MPRGAPNYHGPLARLKNIQYIFILTWWVYRLLDTVLAMNGCDDHVDGM